MYVSTVHSYVITPSCLFNPLSSPRMAQEERIYLHEIIEMRRASPGPVANARDKEAIGSLIKILGSFIYCNTVSQYLVHSISISNPDNRIKSILCRNTRR